MLGFIELFLLENSVIDLGDLMCIFDCLLYVLLGDYVSEVDMMVVFMWFVLLIMLLQFDYLYVEIDVCYLIVLLENVLQQCVLGVNILLYGVFGIGKMELVCVLVCDVGCELYEVDCFDKDGNSFMGKDCYCLLQVLQVFLCG